MISYQSGKNELLLRDLLSPEAVKLRLTPNTQVVQDGHVAYASQLVPGTLVDVDFISQKDDRDAQKISILAVPGTDFTFAGVVTSLDLHIGLLVLTSKRTGRLTRSIWIPLRLRWTTGCTRERTLLRWPGLMGRATWRAR